MSLRAISSLIIVCCHAIYLGRQQTLPTPIITSTDEGWLLEPFQHGESETFIAHIKASISLLSTSPSAILVFSGGPTKPDQTLLSEAQSYLNYARQHLQLDPDVRLRMFVDNFATDSFQNILFPLLQFPLFVKQLHGPEVAQPRFPSHLTVISHAFKKSRFEELHLPALKYPSTSERFGYVGIDPPFSSPEKQEQTLAGEFKFGFGAWKDDPYGAGRVLAGKRLKRGWDEQRRREFQSQVLAKLGDERSLMEELVAWTGGIERHPCGGPKSVVFARKLPWEQLTGEK